jgi:hypothetical protein
MRKGNQLRCRYVPLCSQMNGINEFQCSQQPHLARRSSSSRHIFPRYYSNKSVFVPLRNAVTEGWEREKEHLRPLAPHRKERGRWVFRAVITQTKAGIKRSSAAGVAHSSRSPAAVPSEPRAALIARRESDYHSCCFFLYASCRREC